MDYKKEAEDLLNYLLIRERNDFVSDKHISEISQGEVAVLLYLQEHPEGMYPVNISQHFNINSSRVAAILKSLSKKGYIERLEDLNDKRKAIIRITENGINHCLKKKESILLSVSVLLEELGEDDAREHIRIMRKIAMLKSRKVG